MFPYPNYHFKRLSKVIKIVKKRRLLVVNERPKLYRYSVLLQTLLPLSHCILCFYLKLWLLFCGDSWTPTTVVLKFYRILCLVQFLRSVYNVEYSLYYAHSVLRFSIGINQNLMKHSIWQNVYYARDISKSAVWKLTEQGQLRAYRETVGF